MNEFSEADCNGHISEFSVLNASFTEKEIKEVILKFKQGKAE